MTKIYDEGDGDAIGVPYEEWRLDGDPLTAEECDPRDFEDPEACVVTLIECRDIAKPLVVTYLAKESTSTTTRSKTISGPAASPGTSTPPFRAMMAPPGSA